MRHLVAATLAFGTFLVTGLALAETHFDKSSRSVDIFAKRQPALIASSDPAPLDVAAPSAPPLQTIPARDAPEESGGRTPPATAPGVVLGFGTGVSVLAGGVAEGVNIGGAFFDVSVQVAGYFNRHVGIVAGVQGGAGTLLEGCAGDCETAIRYQVPVMMQYAVDDRRHGLFLDGGVGLLTGYVGSTSEEDRGETGASESLHVTTPFDLKLGVGYRIQSGPAPSRSSLEARLGLDVGRFASLDYSNGSRKLSGEIADEARALHFAFGFSAGYTFAP